MAAIDPSFIEEITITSLGGGKSFNLAQVTVTFKYEEDLFSPMVTAQVLVANTGVGDKQAIYHALPIRGGESVSIKIPANSDNNRDLEFTGENVLYVSSITNVLIGPTREVFTLNLVSRHAITNETSRVGGKFGEKISDSVKKIIKDHLKDQNEADVDETENKYKFLGNMRKPFTLLTWLAAKSVPSKSDTATGSTAGYFFYQTQNGFHYKAIDGLCGQEPVEKYMYSPGVIDNDDPRKDFRAIDLTTSRNHNFVENLERGAYCSHRQYYNPRTGTFTTQKQGEFKVADHATKMVTLGRKFEMSLPEEVSSAPSRLITAVADIGTLEKDQESAKQNADQKLYHSQSMMRYNMIFNIVCVMSIPLNTNLIVGDVIDISIPKIDLKKEKTVEEEFSGLYLIKQLIHQYETSGSFTKLKLIKDTMGRRAK